MTGECFGAGRRAPDFDFELWAAVARPSSFRTPLRRGSANRKLSSSDGAPRRVACKSLVARARSTVLIAR